MQGLRHAAELGFRSEQVDAEQVDETTAKLHVG